MYWLRNTCSFCRTRRFVSDKLSSGVVSERLDNVCKMWVCTGQMQIFITLVAFYSWPDICIANEKRWPRRKNKQNLQISKFCNERPSQATETPSVEKHAHPPRVVYCAIYLTLTLITKFRVSNLHITTR